MDQPTTNAAVAAALSTRPVTVSILLGALGLITTAVFQPLGGDLSGTIPNPTILKINGTPIASAASQVGACALTGCTFTGAPLAPTFYAGTGGATGQQTTVGYNTTGDYGTIQATHQGTGFTPLQLNAGGGVVSIGPGGATSTGPLFVTTAPNPTVTNLYTSPPTNMAAISPSGALLSFAGLPGHLPGDSERAQLYVKTTSQTGPTIEETAQDVEISNTTGFAYNYLPSQPYPASAFVHSGAGVYQNSGACTTGTNSAPSGTGTSTDGTCTWTYAGNTNSDGKSASLLSAVMGVNGGHMWGQAIDAIAGAGAMGGSGPGGFMVGQEIDVTNGAKDCPVGVTGGCFVAALYLAGSTTYMGSGGVIGGGGGTQSNPLYHQGAILLPYFAKDIGFNDSTNATVGFQSSGTHTDASFKDTATSPTGFESQGTHTFAGFTDSASNDAFYSTGTHTGSGFHDTSTSAISYYSQGNHSIAGIFENSTSPIGLDFTGIYSSKQILGNGFAIDPSGNAVVKNLFATGHIAGTGAAPAISASGGTPTLSTGANDNHGTITNGSTAGATVTLTWASARTNAPDCISQNIGTGTLTRTTPTATSWQLTFSAAGGTATYICMGQ